jgi:L-ascorbate metabolism protein UlaG (beta-lactamase superfamily)
MASLFTTLKLCKIDFVLVTHAHFDHLDGRTLRRVASERLSGLIAF